MLDLYHHKAIYDTCTEQICKQYIKDTQKHYVYVASMVTWKCNVCKRPISVHYNTDKPQDLYCSKCVEHYAQNEITLKLFNVFKSTIKNKIIDGSVSMAKIK